MNEKLDTTSRDNHSKGFDHSCRAIALHEINPSLPDNATQLYQPTRHTDTDTILVDLSFLLVVTSRFLFFRSTRPRKLF